MATGRVVSERRGFVWTPQRVRLLRGKRTRGEFGKLLGAQRNTVWRWEAGRASPDERHARALSRLASWRLVGSLKTVEPIDGAAEEVRKHFRESLEQNGSTTGRLIPRWSISV